MPGSFFDRFSKKKKAQQDSAMKAAASQMVQTSYQAEIIKPQLSAITAFVQSAQNQRVLNTNGHINFTALDEHNLGIFNINTPEHAAILGYTVQNFQKQLSCIKTIDTKVAMTCLVSMTALAFSFMLPFAGISLGLALAGAFYMGRLSSQRETAYKTYSESLDNLCAVYAWVMNDPKAKVGKDGKQIKKEMIQDEAYNLLHPNVQVLVDETVPMLNEKALKLLTRNDMEDQLESERQEHNKQKIEASEATPMVMSLSFLLYGKGQGGASGVVKGMFALVKDTVLSLVQSAKELFQNDEPQSGMSF